MVHEVLFGSNAVVGSTRVARLAGISAAIRPTTAIAMAAATNAVGSSADTSNSRLVVTRVSAAAPASPMTRPAAIITMTLRTISAKHVIRARAERHADADLATLLMHRVRDDAVEAERGEQRRHRREDAD